MGGKCQGAVIDVCSSYIIVDKELIPHQWSKVESSIAEKQLDLSCFCTKTVRRTSKREGVLW